MMRKRGTEWDPTHWKWDGDLFLATKLNPPNYKSRQLFPLESGIPMGRFSSNSSSSCSDEANIVMERGKIESEMRKRVNLVVEEEEDDDGSLSLKPGGGGGGYVRRRTEESSEVVNWEGGKRPKLMTGGGAGGVVCRVEDCGADLSKAKTYHRRHKVCEMHSKASKALVGNVLQRFCQQCSRFHALEEFDEGKRSCRRRLAGHNRRRRKTEAETVVNRSTTLNDNQATGYLSMSLLKILSDIHSGNRPHDGAEDQELLSHLLRNLGNNGNKQDTNMSAALLLQESQRMVQSNCPPLPPPHPRQHHDFERQQQQQQQQHASVEMVLQNGLHNIDNHHENLQNPARKEATSPRRTKFNNFDLNDVYVDSDDSIEEDVVISPVPASDSLQSSPPQTSGNSESASSHSPSTSSVDTQSRTGRIVFKIFGKEPSDFPFVLRAQILDWLAQSPSEIESYIRPGCIILTIYLRLTESSWEELCSNLSSSLERLVDVSDDATFWGTGWICVRVENQIAFMYNGEVVADTCITTKKSDCSRIQSVRPVAISESEQTQFSVKGYNLLWPSTRLLCGVEGNYLVQATNKESVDESMKERDGLQCLNFSCSIPTAAGRGFIEVESHGIDSGSSFFPLIVAEKDICTEIRSLESDIETEEDGSARSGAMDFLHEMGWLLHRNSLRSRLGDLDTEPFSLKRYRWLMEFSIDHDWSAVVKKLLDILLDGTVVGEGSLKVALFEMGLLHKAVRRNSRAMVELLLGYAPQKVADELKPEYDTLVAVDESRFCFLFRPDAVGPGGLTPLHVAAGRDGSENLIDAFTDDPGQVGIEAWKNTRDSTGSTPEDYARLRGYYSYIHLVQRKINKKIRASNVGDVVLEIPSSSISENKEGSLEIIRRSNSSSPNQRSCKLCCEKKLVYGRRTSLVYRPAMLSMVAVAAVCVCVALLLKSSPEVLFILHPFRWEKLESGSY
jgi:hypothetical protein